MPMTVSDTLANSTRAAHDVGLAAWLGGAMFGKFAHNPSLINISSHSERGKVANAAWNGYNAINAAGLGAAALGWGAARLTEATPANCTDARRRSRPPKTGLMVAAVLTGIANGVQGARLAKQAPDGAVPVETGTKAAAETPPEAAKIQRSIATLGNLNSVAGVALVGVNAVLAQTDHSRPATRRALTRSSSPNGVGQPTVDRLRGRHRRRRPRPGAPEARLAPHPKLLDTTSGDLLRCHLISRPADEPRQG